MSPNKYRRDLRTTVSNKYKDKLSAKQSKELREPKGTSYLDVDKYDDVFNTITPEVAKGKAKIVFHRNKE